MNSLGLDVSGSPQAPPPSLPDPEDDIEESTAVPRVKRSDDLQDGEEAAETDPTSPTSKREKAKPYNNPERINTGGIQRPKLTADELEERMNRIKLQNEKIKEKREKVRADEAAFNTTVATENAVNAKKEAERRKLQAEVDHSREENAKRKLSKMNNREWDHHKQDDKWKKGKRPTGDGGFWSNSDQAAAAAPPPPNDGPKGKPPPKRPSQDKESPSKARPEPTGTKEAPPVANGLPQTEGKSPEVGVRNNGKGPRRDSKANKASTSGAPAAGEKLSKKPVKLETPPPPPEPSQDAAEWGEIKPSWADSVQDNGGWEVKPSW